MSSLFPRRWNFTEATPSTWKYPYSPDPRPFSLLFINSGHLDSWCPRDQIYVPVGTGECEFAYGESDHLTKNIHVNGQMFFAF
jgi:hypothetical protein